MEKIDFQEIVIQNTSWLMKYILSMVKNEDIAQDIIQEAFIRAYKNYDSYMEKGKIKEWLKMIALNCTRRYFNKNNNYNIASLDESFDDCESSLSFADKHLADKYTPEDEILHKEILRQIMNAITNLPDIQREIIVYRYIKEYSINEVAAIISLPEGTVKSKSYYALCKIRKALKDYFMEGDIMMTCKQAYSLLFEYAKGTLAKDNRTVLEQHLATCKECNNIVAALSQLKNNLTTALEDENVYYMIIIPLANGKILTYSAFKVIFNCADKLNEILKETNGVIPDNENWIDAGHDADYEHLAEYDNNGDKVEFDLIKNPDVSDNIRVVYRKIKKIYPVHWCYSVFLSDKKWIRNTKEDPNLYIGKVNNLLGNNAKSALYLALPQDAKNIRIRKGNGVINTDTLKFAFVDRYVTEDERLALECSYLKD